MREVLDLPAFADGLAEVLVGADALEARVRWVHASDSPGVARLLVGGELLLSTGSGWPADPDLLTSFVEDLVTAGLSGIVLELGTHYSAVPPVIVQTAQTARLAVIALHREVKFVTITEAVHSRIIAEQMAALRARDEVRERFTALALRGSPADFVVEQLGATLASPVILEDLSHEIIAAHVPLAHEGLFADWEARSRLAHRAQTRADPSPGWLLVPVEAQGTRWATLIALPGPPHAAGRLAVLEQGAIALALGRLAGGGNDEWAQMGRRRLLGSLLDGRYSDAASAAERLRASGLPVRGARLYGIVIAGATISAARTDAAARALTGRALSAPAPPELASPATIILLSLPEHIVFDDAAARRFSDAVGAADTATISVGDSARDVDGAIASLQQAILLAGESHAGDRIRRTGDRPMARVVTSLRDDHRLREHAERTLAPLVDYDIAHGGDLLTVLAALLAHPGNRTAAASRSHLSRSVFYQRLALISDLLDVDLDDGETLTALHLALLARNVAGPRVRG
ncbi:PucR family transcriptional regulator ligand-binding domain-containing protein [uncultured Microbacterium sp.]|uniref:PucR family transcriptional regulator n=1 Tax=uncultured Microbacterium sp. TaxID=191216 RepID=UPI0035CAEC5A